MCIVCNCGDDGLDFLDRFAFAQAEMQRACSAMRQCAQTATTPDTRRQYDATHKAMVRICRDWNRVEQLREQGHSTPPRDAAKGEG